MSEHRALMVRTARGVSLETLRQILTNADLRWVYAERMADTGLGTVSDLLAGEPLGAPQDGSRPGVELARWEHGRAFGPDLEVDWWREGDTFRLRALSEVRLPQGVDWQEPGDGPALVVVGASHAMMLYGSYDKKSPPDRPTWSEDRVPRHLAYPVPIDDSPPERMALVGQDYARHGVVVLTRLVGVIPAGQRGAES